MSGSTSDCAASRTFPFTRWTLVAAAQGEAPAADDALEALCRAYWYPLYAFVRRSGHAPHEAEDLTQAFFARLLAKHDLAAVDREKGRFRSFLLAALQHFLANERDRARAQKRGGGRTPLSLDIADAETRYQLEPADPLTPEKLFDRQWAQALLAHVLAALEGEAAAEGRSAQFEALKPFLAVGSGAISHAEAAARLRVTEGAAKVAVHRLRRRYRDRLRAEIARTVASPEQIDDELRALFAAFA